MAGFLEMRKNIQLCTNALRLEEMLDWFTNPRLTWVIHLDGMREIHDYVCDYPGLLGDCDRRDQGGPCGRVPRHDEHDDFGVTEVDDVIEMMGYLTNEVGIDGMLVAPGYQYSQIDLNRYIAPSIEEKFCAFAPPCERAFLLAREPGLPGLPDG